MIAWFAGIWPTLWHLGLGSSLVLGLLAAAYFSPILKRDFVYAALIVLAAMFFEAVGIHDEAHRRDARERVLIKTVHEATVKAIHEHTKDPYDDPDL